MSENSDIPASASPEAGAVKKRAFWCFVSYKHTDNQEPGREWATWLQNVLERYDVPTDFIGQTSGRGETVPSQIFPIFRDEDELPGGVLKTAITEALVESKSMVVLCSPRVLQSSYVDEEIRIYKRLRNAEIQLKAKRIRAEPIACILDGDPKALPGTEQACIPDALRFKVDETGALTKELDEESLWIDFRLHDHSQGWTTAAAYRRHLGEDGVLTWGQISKHVDTYTQRLATARLRLIATILAVPFGELQKRDQAYRLALARRRMKMLAGVLAIVVTLLIVTIFAAWMAVEQRTQARIQRDQALANLAIIHATDVRSRDPVLALNLSLDAWKLRPGDVAAHRAVLRSYYEPAAFPVRLLERHEADFQTSDSWFSASFFPDGKRLLSRDLSRPESVFIVSLDGTKNELALGTDVCGTHRTVPRVSPDGKSFAVYEHQKGRVSLRALDGAELASAAATDVQCLAFSKGGEKLAFGWHETGGRFGVTVCAKDGTTVMTLGDLTNNADDVAFSPDGNTLAVAADKSLWLIGMDGKKISAISHPDYVTGAAFSPDGQTIATTCFDGMPRLWLVDSTRLFKTYSGHSSRTYSPRFSPDGQWLATASWDGTVRVWHGRTNSVNDADKVLSVSMADRGYSQVEWTPDPSGQWLATAGNDGVLSVWDLTTPRTVDDAGLDALLTDKKVDWRADAYELVGDYRGIISKVGNALLWKLPLEFEDRIWKGEFTGNGGLVKSNHRNVHFPFHPDVIEATVFHQKRLGALQRTTGQGLEAGLK